MEIWELEERLTYATVKSEVQKDTEEILLYCCGSREIKIDQEMIGASDFGGFFGQVERAICLRTANVAAALMLPVSEMRRIAVTAQYVFIFILFLLTFEQNLTNLISTPHRVSLTTC